MHEPLLDRIRDLEKSVQRWRLACLALLLMVVSLLAILGTFGLIYVLDESQRRDLDVARMEAERAEQQSRRALQEAEDARQQLLQMQKENAAIRARGGVDP